MLGPEIAKSMKAMKLRVPKHQLTIDIVVHGESRASARFLFVGKHVFREECKAG